MNRPIGATPSRDRRTSLSGAPPLGGRPGLAAALRRHWALQALAGAALITVALLIAAVWGWNSDIARQGEIITFFINVLIVLGIQVFSGNSGILSFGHLAFVGVGAYVAGILMLDPSFKQGLTGLPAVLRTEQLAFLPATLIAAGAAGVLALLVGIPLMRLSGAAAVIAILSLLLISNVIFSGWTDVTRGADGIYAVPDYTTVSWAFGWAVVAVACARLFKDSGYGLQLQAARDDDLAAASVGVSIYQRRLLAWVISALLCGIAGAVSAAFLTAFSPSNFLLQQTFIVIVMFIAGGMGTVSGAVLGAGFITFLQEFLRGYEGTRIDVGFVHLSRLTGLTQLVLAVIILAVMYLRPRGIVDLHEFDETLRVWARRWKA